MNGARALGTKVARRVVALFVVCALLPVAAAIALSYGSVREALVAERTAMLRAAAANYATSLVDRLGVAESLARTLADGIAAAGDVSHSPGVAEYFRSAAIFEAGAAQTLLGDPGRVPQFALDHGEQARLAAGESVLVAQPSDSGSAGVWIVRRTGARRVALEVSPNFLWSAGDVLPVLTDVCAYATDGAALHCTQQLPGAVLGAFRGRLAGAYGEIFTWEDQGRRNLSAHRELFLRGKFGAAPWTIVVSQAESHALVAAKGVTRAVAPVAVLGLLVAALLGLVQVRRTMGPLRDLTAAAARIGARDFGSKVPDQRDDEFGALARAFNAMSGRLGRQFGSLSAHAEIDAVILSNVDISQVAAIVLRRMAELVAADKHLLLLAEDAEDGAFRVHSGNAGDGLDGRTLVVPAAGAGELLAAPEGLRLAGDGRSALAGLAGLRTRHAFALPIAVGDALAGALLLAYVDDRVPGAEDIEILRGLGDRIAVAISTARRDRELDRRAHYDSLTQLPNRQLGLEELARAVAGAARRQKTLAVLFVDLDGFSAVNDSLGHPAGDQLLVQCAGRLRASVRKSDFVARLGGDEFAVVLPEVREGADAAQVARHTIEALSSAFSLGSGTAFVSASVGIALYPADGADAAELLRHADLAMYRAKQQGRGQIAFFEPSMNEELQRRFALEQELRVALEQSQFELHYQPQLDLASGRLVGGEALIRWRHPLKGMVPPLQFIGFAESTGQIDAIGRWALEAACAQFVAWRAQGIAIEHVSVNVSPRQLRNPEFVQQVSAVLAAAHMPAGALRLEITESAVIDDHGASHGNLAALGELGIRLELDDFGTGYSSLAYLQRLPVAAIKLDRAFTRDIETKDSARTVVRAAIDMAHALGKTVVAEGVENAEQLALLQRLGCDTMQGYHIGRPAPADEFALLLHNRAQATQALPARARDSQG
jgi:diguanylate cyclase (GGDEF)-like protein